MCHASVCFPCARSKLSRNRRCPSCGDVTRNMEALNQYLAAGEAWDQALSIASRASEGVMGALTTGGDFMTGFDSGSTSQVYDQEFIRRSVTAQSMLNVSHHCHFCQTASSSFDLTCSRCHASVCSDCLCSRLMQHPCCPCCGDNDVFNESSIQILAGAAQVGKTASQLFGGLWDLGNQLFFDASPSQRPLPGSSLTSSSLSPSGRRMSEPGIHPGQQAPFSSFAASPDFVVRRKHGSEPGRASSGPQGSNEGFMGINFTGIGFQHGDSEVISPSRSHFATGSSSDTGHLIRF